MNTPPRSTGQSSRRVLLWDPGSTGHHDAWLRILVQNRPPGLVLVVPDWFCDSDLASIPQSPDKQARQLASAVRVHDIDGIILCYASYMLGSYSISKSIPRVPHVAIDLATPQTLLNRRRSQPRLLSYGRGLQSLLSREILIRRVPARFAVFDPVSLEVGSELLRARTTRVVEPLEHLEAYPASRWPELKHRIVVAGSIQERKGVSVLALALSLLADQGEVEPSSIEVLIAGPVSRNYLGKLSEAEDSLQRRGYSVRIIDRFLSNEELAALLHFASIVALPYLSHRGPSGLLGSMATIPGPAVIASDYGLMGEQARATGVSTFANGDYLSLADALQDVLSKERSKARSIPEGVGSPEAFAHSVWDLLERMM